ncbi:MAG: fibronectin type III domain-containing protein [Elusimicrobiota bacterium]|nr:fibronectin type III domain-containing protein [Elusimicrobiota bacterium]
MKTSTNIRRVFFALLFFIQLSLLGGSPVQGMSDEEFLDMVEEETFWFFWNETNPSNGLIQDRATNFTSHTYDRASIASVGFGLTSICVAHSRGWISYNQAYNRILITLKTFRDGPVENEHGFFYHWLNMDTGARYGTSEVSSIDTTLFLAGALFAGQYFKGTEIETIADELYRAADWIWMSDDGTHQFVNMSWTPEFLFGPSYWSSFNEGVLLDVLAIGSPTHPRNVDCWTDMQRLSDSYGGYTLIYCLPNNPLFVHQYPHIWIDFRRKEYAGTNYFENSRKATLANRKFCIDYQDDTEDDGDDYYTTYSLKCWGLTSGDGPSGYTAYGAKPGGGLNDDGTVQPTASAGSIMFTPEESIEALEYMYDNYESTIWGKYGFCDGFNLDRSPDWRADDVIGISQGAIMLAIENYRTGMVWDIFMQIPYVTDALNNMGFSDTGDNTRPEKINLKTEAGSNTGEVVLEWTAPGDDENIGKASEYIIRYSEQEINNYATWSGANDVTGEQVPKDAGEKETFTINNLTPGKKYYFAIRAIDDMGNRSILSSSSFASPDRKNSKLNKIYPNPFYPAKDRIATFSYNLNREANVVIEIYNIAGELVEEWSEGYKSEGEHQTSWEGKNKGQRRVSSGIYIVLLRENGVAADRKKMAVIK